MKLEKEVKIIRVKSINSIADGNYTEIKLDGALSNKDFKNIVNNFVGKKLKLTLEIQDSILDDAERKYLSYVIRPFRDKIKYIKKISDEYFEYISMIAKDEDTILFPNFKKDTMYKGMESGKKYTLEDLGL